MYTVVIKEDRSEFEKCANLAVMCGWRFMICYGCITEKVRQVMRFCIVVNVRDFGAFNSTDEEQILKSPSPNSQEATAVVWEILSPPGTRINITFENYNISHQYEPRFKCERGRIFVHDTHNGKTLITNKFMYFRIIRCIFISWAQE